jgi:ribosomal protein S3
VRVSAPTTIQGDTVNVHITVNEFKTPQLTAKQVASMVVHELKHAAARRHGINASMPTALNRAPDNF